MNALDREAYVRFVRKLARMETESEINARTNDAGMPGDDAVATLSALIEEARKLERTRYS